jgi:Ser/Thr protein kinase RdoA (MazF antagonist)
VTRNVRNALASITEDYEVRRELHAVPPHAVYEVAIDGTRAVCKVARGPSADPATEARVMEWVGQETAVPVPDILAVGDDWFVAEWREDLPGDDPPRDEERARTLGVGLATLHEETAGAFDRTGFPRAADGGLAVDARDSWAETVCDQLADRREYLAAFGYGEVAEAARAFVREHPELFDGADESETPVLAHGNYLPEHVGVAEPGDDHDAAAGDHVTCVIDWEHALVAPPEYDYWRAATPLIGGADDPEAVEAAFREGYESVRPLPATADERSLATRMVISVSYLKALHLQRQQTGQAKARFAKRTRESVRDAIERLRP